MQKYSRQALLSRTKAELNRGKGHLLTSIIPLVPRWLGAESAIFLEEFIEISTAKIGRWHPSDCSKLTAKVVNSASSLFNSCPKFHGRKIWQKIEATFRDRRETARRY
jgi:hypothetical protein